MDGAFETMCRRLAANDNPNLLLMNDDLVRLSVTDLMVVPKHVFTRDIIQQWKPLGPTARRAGWVGCNILLGQVPEAGRIFIVRGGAPVDKAAVRAQCDRTLFLRVTGGEPPGWLVEVMRCVERIGRPAFTLAEVYGFEFHLQPVFRATTLRGRRSGRRCRRRKTATSCRGQASHRPCLACSQWP